MRGHSGIEAWCNGSTSDFGSDSLGSNPDASTKSCLDGCGRNLASFPLEGLKQDNQR